LVVQGRNLKIATLPSNEGFPLWLMRSISRVGDEGVSGAICPQNKPENVMNPDRKQRKRLRRKKRTALIICRDRKQFWTTQTQFWQWFRNGTLVKLGDQPLTGAFVRENEELMVLLQHTVLNLANPNHLREALSARRIGLGRR